MMLFTFFFFGIFGTGAYFWLRGAKCWGWALSYPDLLPPALPDSLAKEGCPEGLDQNCWEPHLESEESMFDIFFTFDL